MTKQNEQIQTSLEIETKDFIDELTRSWLNSTSEEKVLLCNVYSKLKEQDSHFNLPELNEFIASEGLKNATNKLTLSRKYAYQRGIPGSKHFLNELPSK